MKKSLGNGAEGKRLIHEIVPYFGCPYNWSFPVLLPILRVTFFSSCYRGFYVSQPCFLMEWSFCCDDDDDDADDDDGDDDDDATSGSSR